MNSNANIITVYAEATPNPHSMKFVANKLLSETSFDFPNVESATNSEFVTQLFKFSFVKGVFIASNFVTITKEPSIEWVEIMPIIREFVKAYVESGDTIVPQTISEKTGLPGEENINGAEEKIKQLLDEYVRPAVEQDGGAINFKSYENGKVTVTLQGACSGCPSSTLTLKAGIETLLKRMMPEVNEVIAESI